MNEFEIREKLIHMLQHEYGFRFDHHRTQQFPNNEYITSDITISGDDKEGYPLLIVEITNNIDPLKINLLIKQMRLSHAKYGMIGNLIDRVYYFQKNSSIIEIPDLPYEGKGPIKLKKDKLRVLHNFSQKLQRIAWIIADGQRRRGIDHQGVLTTIQKILLCKVVDERSNHEYPHFFLDPTDPISPNESVKIISKLFEEAKAVYPGVFRKEEKIDLESDIAEGIILELQSYSVLKTERRIIHEAFEEVVQKFIDPHTGIYLISKKFTDFLVNILNPSLSEKVLDLSTGSGNFLTSCLTHIENSAKKMARSKVNELVRKYSRQELFGLERNGTSVLIAKMNMILHGDGHANITWADPLEYISKYRPDFDIVFSPSIPDYGMKYNRYQSEFPNLKGHPELILIEQGLHLLKNGGRMIIVLPENFMFSHSLIYARDYLLKNFIIKGIISLPAGFFLPYTGIKESLLLIEKKKKDDPMKHKIFMAELTKPLRLSEEVRMEFNVIADAYKSFLRGNELRTLKNPNIFLIDAFMLLGQRWNVDFHVPKLSEIDSSIRNVSLVDQVANISNGFMLTSSKYYDTMDNNKIAYVRISDMVNGRINSTKIKYIENSDELQPYKIHENDILISTRGTVGKVTLVSEEYKGAVASAQIAILRIMEKVALPKYIYFVLMSTFVQQQIQRRVLGSTIRYIRLNDLKEIKIPLPSISEQRHLIEAMEAEESKYQTSLDYVKKNMSDRISDLLV